MPYHWIPSPQAPERLTLTPHRSLPERGFAVMIMTTFLLITIPLYPLIGTVLFWGLLPFLMLALAGLWWGLRRSYRDGEITEVLTFSPEDLHLIRTNPKGDTQEWTCNPYWARAEIHTKGGPVPYYVTLTGNGRTVEIGAFLSEDERRALYGDLSDALRHIRA